jgi:hypothetical protein
MVLRKTRGPGSLRVLKSRKLMIRFTFWLPMETSMLPDCMKSLKGSFSNIRERHSETKQS